MMLPLKVCISFIRKNLRINTIGEVLAAAGKHQLRIAETEKICPCERSFFSGDARKNSTTKTGS